MNNVNKEPQVASPIINIETEPSVRFTQFDQVYQPGSKGEVKMEYVPAQTDNYAQPEFVDDNLSDISEFEDLEATNLPVDDYEEL